MERTEEQRCRVLWLIGLSSSSLSKEAKLRAFRNLGRARGEVRERIRGERLGKKRNMGNKWEKMFGKRTERGNFFLLQNTIRAAAAKDILSPLSEV